MQLARGGDSDAVRLVDDYDWYIMPVLNPDGYSFTFTDVRQYITHFHCTSHLNGCTCLLPHILATLLQKHTNVLLRSSVQFKCRNIDMLLRAYIVYIRPLVEHDSVIWSPFTTESVQRRFTKRLPGLSCFTYHERLKRINIPSLEHRRLYFDLIWCNYGNRHTNILTY